MIALWIILGLVIWCLFWRWIFSCEPTDRRRKMYYRDTGTQSYSPEGGVAAIDQSRAAAIDALRKTNTSFIVFTTEEIVSGPDDAEIETKASIVISSELGEAGVLEHHRALAQTLEIVSSRLQRQLEELLAGNWDGLGPEEGEV